MVKHDGNDLSHSLRRSIGLVAFGSQKQIVKVTLYRLQDQYCHKLQCREIEKETSSLLMQCRVSDCKWFPMWCCDKLPCCTAIHH